VYIHLYTSEIMSNIILQYNGNISKEITISILQIIDNYKEEKRLKKKLYNILVESLQNLDNHSLFKDISFILEKSKDSYTITTKNYINNIEVESLKSKIDYINSLNEEELKSLYKSDLGKGEYSKKGGAGLGLIDIKRKSNSNLIYNFEEVGPEIQIFQLTININL